MDAPTRVPQSLRFPLVAITSFGLSSLLYSIASSITGPELAAISRNLTEGWHIGVMVAWKLAELGVAWYACYDYVDLAYITLLNQVPHYFLLNSFFSIDTIATLVPLAIDISSIAIPFALMRRLNKGHDNSKAKTDNQQVAQDKKVQYLTAACGASAYALVVYSCVVSRLPAFMITHFEGIRSLEKVHSLQIWALALLFVPLGYAAANFIFVPAIASPGNPGITKTHAGTAYVPEEDTFVRAVRRFFRLKGDLTPRAQILAKRTAILAVSSFTNSFVRSYVTIEGTELVGALGWAGMWAVAAAAAGAAFAYVGNE